MKGYHEILEWIRLKFEMMIHQTEEWVNLNSGSDNYDGLDIMCHHLYRTFTVLNGEITHLPLNPVIRMDAHGLLREVPMSSALLITKRPNAPIQILLGGHMDTVFSKESPFQRAHRIDENTLGGPGAADMKGGLVILLYTLLAFEQYKDASNIGWQVLITPDEEIGSISSRSIHLECAKKHHVGMIFEPTLSDGSFVTARRSSLNFALISHGLSSHAGREFHLGKNAIVNLMNVLTKLNNLNEKNGSTTFNIAQISGGGQATNIVPDHAFSKCNLRTDTDEELVAMKNRIHEIIAEENKHDTKIEYFQISERPPKPFDEREKVLFKFFKQQAEELGLLFKEKKSGGVCDGNIWAQAGLPTIDTLGADGGGLHTFDEYIKLDSLVTHTQLCASFLMKVSSGEIQLSKLCETESTIR